MSFSNRIMEEEKTKLMLKINLNGKAITKHKYNHEKISHKKYQPLILLKKPTTNA